LENFDLQKRKKKFIRIVTPGRTYELQADNEEDRNGWLVELEKQLNRQHRLPPEDEEQETTIFLEPDAVVRCF
jgi:hypothetical protein